MKSTESASSERIYYMDLARCVILLTGVFFHAAFVFSNPQWMVVSPWRSEILDAFVQFVRGFRMETLFLVSGFFSAVLVTNRGSKGFFLNRMVRMGVPLVFCGLLFNGMAVMLQDKPIIPWRDAEYFISGTWMLHLWNMANLMVYEAAIFSTLWLVPSLHRKLAEMRIRIPVALFLYLIAVVGLYWIWYRLPSFRGSEMLFQPIALATFAPAYLLGYTVHQNKALREGLFDLRLSIPLAFGLFTLVHAVGHFLPQYAESRPLRMLINLEHISWTLLLFSVVRRFETRHIWVRRIAISSYTIYILHLPLQIALYRYLPAVREGWGAFLFLSIVPIVVVWIFHVQVVERWGWAGFLFNGKIYNDKTRSF
ncbi:MAG TPA: acyltransferase family protein [Fibrobacteria bacterium]|nr:acyltransferase family protein [Fibrobacteria bacterium]